MICTQSFLPLTLFRSLSTFFLKKLIRPTTHDRYFSAQETTKVRSFYGEQN